MRPEIQDVPLRGQLRLFFERSAQPLTLYGMLLAQFKEQEVEASCAILMHETTHGLRRSLQALWPEPGIPYMSLASRAAVLNLLSQTAPEEEQMLGMAVLEHLALHLEPYLQAAEVDPDQRRYLWGILGTHAIADRPIKLFLDARKQMLSASARAERAPAPALRRTADAG